MRNRMKVFILTSTALMLWLGAVAQAEEPFLPVYMTPEESLRVDEIGPGPCGDRSSGRLGGDAGGIRAGAGGVDHLNLQPDQVPADLPLRASISAGSPPVGGPEPESSF